MKKLLLPIASLLMLFLTSFAHAEGGFGDSAAAAITGSQSDITTVAGAIILVVAGIWGFKLILRLIR